MTRTTEEDRVGDLWLNHDVDDDRQLTVTGKFNDWCLEMTPAPGDTLVGVYPLWYLEEHGWKRSPRSA